MYSGEKFNSITHLIGAVLSFVGLGVLLTISIQERNPLLIIGFSVFGATLILLYSMSTLYHSLHSPQLKKTFQKLDHVCIYLLIAGTYTPYMLVSLWDGGGLMMLILIWVFAILGLLLDILLPRRIKWLQVAIYLIMGWLCMFNYSEMKAAFSPSGVLWLTAGGIAYTVGIIFYVLDKMKRLRHAHGVWHLFVLMGSICHFISIAAYVR